jgi:histidine triad (HIT) family protein
MTEQCVFCRIVAEEIPSNIVHRDADFVAFRDINPQAPVHVLIVPRRHIGSLADLAADDAALVGHMVLLATRLAAGEGLNERGYRLVINCGPEGGQVVAHLHLHLLGGRELRGQLG